MALKQTKKRRERLRRLLNNPDLMDTICAHIANGGTLINLAESYDVRFGELSNWVHSQPTREKRYVAALNDRGEWGIERVLLELRHLGYSDIREIFDENTNGLKPVNAWPEKIARAVSSVKTKELYEEDPDDKKKKVLIGYTTEVKFWNKEKALELQGRNLKMFVDRVDVSGSVKLEDLVTGSLNDKENTE